MSKYYLSGYLKVPPYQLYRLLPPKRRHEGVRIYVKQYRGSIICTAKVGRMTVICGTFKVVNFDGSLKLLGTIFGVPVFVEPRDRASEKSPLLSIKHTKTGEEIGVLWINESRTKATSVIKLTRLFY
jgi:hypothetical protein